MPKVKSRQIIKVAEKLGFFFARQKGSHAIYRRIDNKRITIPIHGGQDITEDIFYQIIKDMNISRDEFMKLL